MNSFDGISIIYSVASLYTLWRLVAQWRSFWDREITADDRLLAQQVALFLLVPVGVLFHELGHAAATWQLGGQVLEFQWRVFWGYIIPQGNFTPLGYWWIALSGNAVSLALGLFALALVPLLRRHILAFVLSTFAALQVVVTLVAYPLLSFVLPGFRGDWVSIYDFSVAPYAQIVLVIHLAILAAYWRWQHRPPKSEAKSVVDPGGSPPTGDR